MKIGESKLDIFIPSKIPPPDCHAVGRTQSLFIDDIQENRNALAELIGGKKILAIGAAGSIGFNTIDLVSRFNPKSLHIVDHNENALAEMVRTLRSRQGGLEVDDFRTLPLNYGGKAFEYYLDDTAPFDHILNFAALKHVRSEKDHYSILEMLSTNLILMSRIMSKLTSHPSPQRFFSVSTDKAANPTSIMGASKRLMEHFLFSELLPRPKGMEIVSTRFANVAYSNGSLLQSFQNRLQQMQPLVAPKDCRRYFVSLQEAGHICTLAAFLIPHKTIAIPKLNPEKNLVLLEDILFEFLQTNGYEPVVFEDEHEAREAVNTLSSQKQWPVILTPLNTAGEKPFEEFVGKNEHVVELGLRKLKGVKYFEPNNQSIVQVKKLLEGILAGELDQLSGPLNKDTFRDLIALAEPAFLSTHKDSDENLDQRM